MGLFYRFLKKTEEAAEVPVVKKEIPAPEYIFLYGSDRGAEFVPGNIRVIDNTPHIIGENSTLTQANWDEVRVRASRVSPWTGLWLREIGAENWVQYACPGNSAHQPADTDAVTVCTLMAAGEIAADLIIRKSDRTPCIRYTVANGPAADHYPRWVSVSRETTFEDVRALAAVSGPEICRDINEENWMDKIQVSFAANLYRFQEKETLALFLARLRTAGITVEQASYTSFFKEDSVKNGKSDGKSLTDDFAENWRMFSFKLTCTYQTEEMTIRVNGLAKTAIASFPLYLPDILTK